ncbi:MAG: host specificity protein [Betaproteobacteria bacterium RIFCSPLOWO2_12_FULL_62_58]|nr:MAG: host specificity protein [Betaproteobacteria bacterium RIFCSPLOWO2_02_FULL_62_79]OGA49139.1 MAG: host specificity protein [Betaproteobacteria bacterium RIFCSPLOWO2_12_FULL_62_58]
MTRELPVWRSLMYVPVNVDKYVDKAHTRGADVIQLDLEDSVPPAEKERARTLVEKAAARVRRGGADVVVRINRPLSLTVRDLEHSICPDVDGIACTKIDSGSHVKLLDELVSELEDKRGMRIGHTRFLAMIETADAFGRIDEIPRASPRVVAMNIGGEDFALDCNMQPDEEVLLHPKQRMIIAARAAGVMPLGFVASVAGFGDWDKFRLMVRRSRRFGFDGAGCIHPGQVTIVNEEYTPSEEEVAYARRVIQMDKEAAAAGRGSFQIDGKMIDIPVVVRAQKLLARYEAIQQREAKTLAAAGKNQ